ncbi:MAG: hypothetical protein II437_01995 [Oscillospiraceae bacterium]|jgi:hypothetical protein|nr:hypothetical protein [Oscillospiraceae bacterium]
MDRKRRNTDVEIPPVGNPPIMPNYVAPTANGMPNMLPTPDPFQRRAADDKGPEDRRGYESPSFLLDPLGSWTGRPRNVTDLPVQDADDL